MRARPTRSASRRSTSSRCASPIPATTTRSASCATCSARPARPRVQRAGRALERARHLAHPAVGGGAAASRASASSRALDLTDALPGRGRLRPAPHRGRGLNPHAGDGGNFGSEEIDVIAPAVERAAAEGITVEGPFPSDTVFVRAMRGDVRRGADHVPRPGPDRDEADGLRPGRHPARRLPLPDLHARPTARPTTSPARASPMSAPAARRLLLAATHGAYSAAPASRPRLQPARHAPSESSKPTSNDIQGGNT